MDVIKKKDYDKAKDAPPSEEIGKGLRPSKLFTSDDLKVLKGDLARPVEFMQEMAAKIKTYLDQRMEEEFREFKYISEYTRKWVLAYNDLLEKIQKARYGEKSVSLVGKISLADIGAQMRKADQEEEEDEITVELDETVPDKEK